MANPNSSGTPYTMLATLVQLMGEDKAFDYLKAMHKNVNQYTKSGAAPARRRRAARRRSASRSMHDARRRRRCGGCPVKIVVAVRGHRLRDRLDEHHQGREESRERQEVVRLGADAGGAGARRAGQEVVPGAVEQERAAAAAGAEVRRDQADQLRLRQVRLVGRAHAAARRSGTRRSTRCRSSVATPAAALPRDFPTRPRRCAIPVGARYASCPAHAGSAALAAVPWSIERRRIGARRRVVAGAWPRYAATIALGPLFVAAAVMLVAGWLRSARVSQRSLPGSACAWGFAQGFVAGGQTDPRSASARRSLLAALHVCFARALARLGWFSANVTIATIVVVIAALLIVFIFYPVGSALVAARARRAGKFAPGLVGERLLTADIWGFGCFGGGTRCGVAINSALLAAVVGCRLDAARPRARARRPARRQALRGPAEGDVDTADHHAAVRHSARAGRAVRPHRAW